MVFRSYWLSFHSLVKKLSCTVRVFFRDRDSGGTWGQIVGFRPPQFGVVGRKYGLVLRLLFLE